MDFDKLTIDNLLRFMVEQQASDLHLKPMRPPLMRLKGKLLPLKCDSIKPEELQQMLEGILNDRLRTILERDMAVDFGYSLAGVSRFRASVFFQRGTLSACFRRVPFDFPSLQDWGVPAAVTDLAATPNTKIKVIDIAYLTSKMNAKYGPLYAEAVIPAATYKGMDKDARNNSVWNILVVNASMSDELAYDLTRLMLEKRADLALVHKEALNIKPEWQTSSRAGIPWHPGALKYYTEKGYIK